MFVPYHRRAVALFAAATTLLLAVGGCSPGGGTDGMPGSTAATTATGSSVVTGPRQTFGGAPLVPAEGVYLGLYYGDGTVADTDAAVGRVPQINLTYVGWADEWATSDAVREDAARGQISLVNWEPFDVDFAAIVRGDHDEMLTTRARQAGALAQPVFLDFAAEMNEEEGWGGHDPQLYVSAYRHIHDIFARYDNGNVVWVWAPNNVDTAGAPPALAYYPGADYVDWTGMDGYNWGTAEPGFQWQSFEQVFGPLYDDLATLGKPIIIGETGSAEDGGSKPRWIADIGPTLESRFPDIRAVVWFDVRKERDWRFRSSTGAADAFQQLAANPGFAATRP